MAIYKKGNNWYIDYYVKGRRKRKKIGPSKKLAEQVLKDVHVKLARGEYLGVLEEKKVPFKDFTEKYLEYSRANKTASSHRRDTVLLKNLVSVFGEKNLSEFDSSMVEDYKIKRLGGGSSPATVNREVSCLKNLFNKAVEWGSARKNPVRGVRMLKEPPGRIRYLEREEIERLLKATDSLPSECGRYLRPIVVTALNTGFRKNEILQLKWKDIDFNGRKITVLKTKTNEIRTVPMNEMLWRELKNAPRHPESEYIFCNEKGSKYNNVRKSFDRALKLAGITDFRFHDLRHTFASHLVMSGTDIRTVQQLMGHKEIKMTMRYAHLSRSHLQDAVDRLGNSWTPYGHQKDFSRESSGELSVVSSGNTEG